MFGVEQQAYNTPTGATIELRRLADGVHDREHRMKLEEGCVLDASVPADSSGTQGIIDLEDLDRDIVYRPVSAGEQNRCRHGRSHQPLPVPRSRIEPQS